MTTPGIYKRGAGHSLHAVFFYVSKAKYRMIFDFYGLSRRVADEAFPRLHLAAMAKWTDR